MLRTAAVWLVAIAGLVAIASACADIAPTGRPIQLPTSGAASSNSSGVASPTPAPGTPSAAPASADMTIPDSLAHQFVSAIVGGDYDTAWRMLGAQTQDQYGSLRQFTSDRKAFMESAEDKVEISGATNAADVLARWVGQLDGVNPDPTKSFVVEVHYPVLAWRNADLEVLVIAPDANGDWRIWIAR